MQIKKYYKLVFPLTLGRYKHVRSRNDDNLYHCCAVSELSQAAKQLYKSTATISYRIKILEEYVGVQLSLERHEPLT